MGAASCSWLPRLASAAGPDPKRKRSCILLWMAGGPDADRYLGHEARACQRGRVLRNGNQRPWSQVQRALQRARSASGQVGRAAWHEHFRGRSPARHLLDAHRPAPWGPAELPIDRGFARQSDGKSRNDAAELRGGQPKWFSERRGDWAWLPRSALCRRDRWCPGRPTDATGRW